MDRYLEPTQESGAAFVRRGIAGPVVMLNLLRFRDIADYSAAPELAPDEPITGAAAYRRYEEHTAPFLEEAGGEVLFKGAGGHVLVGPPGERWDLVLLVQHQSSEAFLSFATNQDYLAGIGHRTAALEDSRLLPVSADGDLVA
jgi:uncharacterized protein (DUF1330 family)